MKMERDFDVYYSTEIKHKSLYEWCLRQTHKDGTQVSRDLIPWWHTLDYEATDISHHIYYRRVEDNYKENEEREVLHVKIVPIEGSILSPRYYMFGYRDAVEMISLTITRSSNIHCSAFSFAKYRGGAEFHEEDIPHHLGFQLKLSEEKFDKILQLMRMNTLERLSFSAGLVDGFYSDWSPDIITDSIHILPRSCLADLNLEEHADRLPTIGKVRDFHVSASRKIIVDHKIERVDA